MKPEHMTDDEPEPQPGALDYDLLPEWHVLDGSPHKWRLVAIFDPHEPALTLMRESWRSPAPGEPPRWCVGPGGGMSLGAEQTAKLIAVLTANGSPCR